MGLEDHRIALDCTWTTESVVDLLRERLDFALAELVSPTTVYLEYTDSQHIIEAEVFAADDHTHIALRFALCQPASVDRVFERLVRQLIEEVGATISGAEHEAPQHALRLNFDAIQVERVAWQRVFGAETLRTSCLGAIERFVAPSWGRY
jgi:hypothetical protein